MSNPKKSKKDKKPIVSCVNPYNDHGYTTRREKLHEITTDFVEKAKLLNITLRAKEYLCQSCYARICQKKITGVISSKSEASGSGLSASGAANVPEKRKSEDKDSSDMDVDETSESDSSGSVYDESTKQNKPAIVDKLNEALMLTHITSIDKASLRTKSYKQKKLLEIIALLSDYVFEVTNPATDGDEIISQLETKFKSVESRSEKIEILSVLPMSWTVSQIQARFNVTEHMARRVKIIVDAKNTILCRPEKKLGSKTLSVATVEAVQKFYREDISSECPGMRDYVTVNDDGKKDKKQRLLVLMNLKEAHAKFKDKFPDNKIGFSKFAELRPAECVLAMESYGTHTTCVCTYHQNSKLMLTALQKIGIFNEFKTFRHLLATFNCDQVSDKCQLGECEACKTRFKEAVDKLEDDLHAKMLDNVTFMQWTDSSGKLLFYVHIYNPMVFF